MLRVIFHPLAKRELVNAATYYAQESPGFENVFLNAVVQSERQILQYPDAGAKVCGGIRRRLLKDFPYALIYRVEPGRIRINASLL